VVSRQPGAKFAPERDRYVLLVCYACPFAHRVSAVRQLKGLGGIIPAQITYWDESNGYRFATPAEGREGPKVTITLEPLAGATHLKEIYLTANPSYVGKFPTPALWDKKLKTVVSNESAQVVRFFNTEFDDLVAPGFRGKTFYPKGMEAKIYQSIPWATSTINIGVYNCGFAK
jgi:putative glutathione S-transferase